MAPRESISTKISICVECEGKGTISKSELQDYHKGEYRYWDVLCGVCKGSGRQQTVITANTEITPYYNHRVSELEAEILVKKLKEDKQDK